MAALSILVVDDDPDILKILKDNLELDGYAVVTSTGGRQALETFKKKPADLVVLDLMLPDMDGIQVCRALRSESSVPIIMLTAKDGVSDKVLGLESGADDYLVKPFDDLELAARIRACLRRQSPLPGLKKVMETGRIRLDPNRREVRIGARALSLTKKEFDLLELLFTHAGKALSREAIRRALWPDRSIYRWSRTIDVHIQHLRTKLEKNPERPEHIVTVQGIGYMFAPETPPE